MTLDPLAADRLERAETRRRRVRELHEQGLSFNEIGAKLGISPGNASRLHQRSAEVARERATGLTPRAKRIIDECGHDVAALRRRLARGPGEVVRILRRRAACGPKQVEEIIAWLGKAS